MCPIILVLNAQDWVPLEAKARLLEWKIRMDLVQYAARKCPEIRLDRILAYEPKAGTSPEDNGKSSSAYCRTGDSNQVTTNPTVPLADKNLPSKKKK